MPDAAGAAFARELALGGFVRAKHVVTAGHHDPAALEFFRSVGSPFKDLVEAVERSRP